MTRRTAATVAWSLWVLGVAAIVAAAIIGEAMPPRPGIEDTPFAEDLVWSSSWFGFGAVGALVVGNRPRSAIGWILSGITFGVGASLLFSTFARYAHLEMLAGPVAGPAAWLSAWLFVPTLGAVVALVILFPQGRPETRAGRWLLGATVAVVTADTLVYAFRPGPVEGTGPPDNPLGLPFARGPFDAATVVLGTALAAIGIAAAVDAAVRFHRSRGIARLQFRWFALAAVSFPILFVVTDALPDSLVPAAGFDPVVLAFALGGNGLAAAIGVAVTRHGLYEIDRVISRTLSWALLSIMLAATFVGTVLVLRQVLPAEGDLAVAASTLAVAALFAPLRGRIQSWVDRRFNRSRYDAGRLVDAFTDRIRGGAEVETLADDLAGVSARAMEPASVSVWLRNDHTDRARVLPRPS